MKKIFKQINRLVLTSVCVLMGASCESDVWKDHYSVKSYGSESVASLAQTIAAIPEAARFVEVLKSTYVYNGDKETSLTYWDFLNDNQFLTVWLPDESQVKESEWESYLAEDKDHKKVGNEFILNHIARFSHPVGDDTYEPIKMMSNKTYKSTAQSFDGIGYKEKNRRCTNGLLHRLDGRIVYKPNIYDYLTGKYSIRSSVLDTLYDYKSRVGEWIKSYMVETIDEERSIESGINEFTGEIEYIDKVVKRKNSILEKYGFIDVEDSNYFVVLPIPSVWDEAYDHIKSYFSYDMKDEEIADKVSDWQIKYTKSAMITDAFFNRNIQKHMEDSITSTLFRKSERMKEKHPYHVYYEPYKDKHLLGSYNDETGKGVIDSVICSNGVIYVRKDWPYSDSIFRKPIIIEAEDIAPSGKEWRLGRRTVSYLDENSATKTASVLVIDNTLDSWTCEFNIKDILKGQYKIKMVFFHNSSQEMSNKVNVKVTFLGNDGMSTSSYSGTTSRPGGGSTKNNYIVGEKDKSPITINVGQTSSNLAGRTFEFPYGNYGNDNPKIRLTLSNVGGDGFTQAVWLDCIIFEPVF